MRQSPTHLAAVLVIGCAVACSSPTTPGNDWTAQVTDRSTIGAVSTYRLEGSATGIATAARLNEIAAEIYVPTGAGPHRVVFIQHGGHTVCADPDQAWPCDSPDKRTPSYLGYRYLGAALADAGYIAVSISANGTIGSADIAGIPAIYDYWWSWLTRSASTTDGPLRSELLGKVDSSSITLIGHSRGGDAVAQYAAGRLGNTAAPIAEVALLAPVLPVDDSAGTALPMVVAPVLTVVGSCDGDAGDAGVNWSHSFTDPASRLETVTGANHNFYNTEWTPGTGVADSIDDGPLVDDPTCAAGSATRLSPRDQQQKAVDLILDFLPPGNGP